MNNVASTVRVVICTDGKRGHENQSRVLRGCWAIRSRC